MLSSAMSFVTVEKAQAKRIQRIIFGQGEYLLKKRKEKEKEKKKKTLYIYYVILKPLSKENEIWTENYKGDRSYAQCYEPELWVRKYGRWVTSGGATIGLPDLCLRFLSSGWVQICL